MGSDIHISEEMFRALAPLAQQHGLDLGDFTQLVPKLHVNTPIRRLSEQIGQLLAKTDFYLMGENVVHVDDATGEVRMMTGVRFTSEVERHVQFIKAGTQGGEAETSIGKDKASQVLESSAFRRCLRPLEAVERLRLPVRRADGTVELLPEGYDEEARVLTRSDLAYDDDMDGSDALLWLNELLGEYPWADREEKTLRGLQANRSASVLVTAMLGVFCRHMFRPGTKRPMILILGNQPGTGKSTLVQMILAPVYGLAGNADCPKSAEEMEKLLATEAQTFSPFVWFDDLGAGLYSNALNRFVTAARHKGRVMGGNKEKFDVPNVSQVFATGNNVETSADLMRRSLIVELFLAGEVRDRVFDHVIDDEWLASDEVRAKTCAALWSMVKVWMECPAKVGVRPRPTFEEWTGTLAHIVQSNHWSDPLVEPDLPSGGDREDQEFRMLLIDLASGIDHLDKDGEEWGPVQFTRSQMVERARELEVLESLVGAKGEPDLKAGESRKFGRRLQKWRGRKLVDKRGRAFEFGRRRARGGSTYPLRFV